MQCNERNKETHEITLDVHITLYVCVWLTHTYNVMWTSRVISHVSLFFTLHCTCVSVTHTHTCTCNVMRIDTTTTFMSLQDEIPFNVAHLFSKSQEATHGIRTRRKYKYKRGNFRRVLMQRRKFNRWTLNKLRAEILRYKINHCKHNLKVDLI